MRSTAPDEVVPTVATDCLHPGLPRDETLTDEEGYQTLGDVIADCGLKGGSSQRIIVVNGHGNRPPLEAEENRRLAVNSGS